MTLATLAKHAEVRKHAGSQSMKMGGDAGAPLADAGGDLAVDFSFH